MTLAMLQDWLDDNQPPGMPFWPGARCTGRMGLRETPAPLEAGANPLHLGVDRAGGGMFLAPFNCRLEWKPVDGPAGSLLRLCPGYGLEVQVFHTEGPEGVTCLEHWVTKGERLPVKPGKLGMSTGVHTHTEVLIGAELTEFMRGKPLIVEDGKVNKATIKAHCQRTNLHYPSILYGVERQVETWGIIDMSSRHAVRRRLPAYRGWHEQPVLLVDSLWLLEI